MSTGKRLAKRSIIGTRVCAPGPDGLWYSGVIQDVKTPPIKNSINENNNCINLTPDTKYVVRFDFKTHQTAMKCGNSNNINNNPTAMDVDNNNYTAIDSVAASLMLSPAQSVRRNAMIKEFREHELIGPGFRSIVNVHLQCGQRVFLTYNGREVSGDVQNHDLQKDEVLIKVTPIGYEEPLELKKRLDEVRLLESRRSARLADQERDTDFARLADMAGDRRRTSHSIDVPLALTQHNSRKRRPSYSQDERENFLTQFGDDDQMDACNAALVLMSLSCSPRSPSAGQWHTVFGSSPGSSNASWSSSGTSSPPLSDDGTAPMIDVKPRIRTASLSTSDEGIVMDYNDEAPRKRRAHGPIFQCTWKGCGVIEATVDKIERHVRNTHLGPKKPRHSFDDDGAFSDSDHEEEFYYTEIEEDEGKAPSPPSPPTLSHRDMARPPHEDPEYQRQIVGNFRQGLLALSQSSSSSKSSHSVIAGPINIPTSPLAHHNYTWNNSSQVSPMKHARWSPRPSTSSAPYPSPTYVHHHYNNSQQQHSIHQHQHPPQQQQNVSVVKNGGIQHQSGGVGGNLSHSAPTSISYLTTASPNVHHPTSQHTNMTAQPTSATQHLQSPVQQTNRSPQSPNRRTRGENKKCRKVYGMDHKDQWCTQCKWKKACSRFGD